MFNVLICDPISINCVEKLKEEKFNVIFKPNITRESLIEEVKDKDALVVRGRTKVDATIMDNATKLKVIVRAGVGLDNIDLQYAQMKGIEVFNTPEAVTNAVAELTICFIISLLRNVHKGNSSLKKGEWIKNLLIGSELKSKTVGILGFGRIGMEVAKKLKAFDCRILCYSRTDKSEIAKKIGVDFTNDLDYLLRESDILTVHLTLNNETYKFLNRERLAKMKKGAYLINTSRGAIIDEEALLEVLENGHLAGAALDVFEYEPPQTEIEKRLLRLENVLVTPHIGAQTKEAMEKEGEEVARILIDYFKKIKI
jgi:D-3-phosphoglycerate dehydrogenase